MQEPVKDTKACTSDAEAALPLANLSLHGHFVQQMAGPDATQ